MSYFYRGGMNGTLLRSKLLRVLKIIELLVLLLIVGIVVGLVFGGDPLGVLGNIKGVTTEMGEKGLVRFLP